MAYYLANASYAAAMWGFRTLNEYSYAYNRVYESSTEQIGGCNVQTYTKRYASYNGPHYDCSASLVGEDVTRNIVAFHLMPMKFNWSIAKYLLLCHNIVGLGYTSVVRQDGWEGLQVNIQDGSPGSDLCPADNQAMMGHSGYPCAVAVHAAGSDVCYAYAVGNAAELTVASIIAACGASGHDMSGIYDEIHVNLIPA
jgi:hypothetical protein